MKVNFKRLWFGKTVCGRQIYLDYLRVIATVFVIGVHTVSLAATMVEPESRSYFILEFFNFMFLSCNQLFIMISGALLLPVQGEGAITFFRKRFSKVAIPLVVYYILYVCAKEGIEWIYPNHWMPLFQRILLGAPEEAPHFWLVYVILWLYVLTPFLRWIVSHIPNNILSGVIVVIFIVCAIDTYLPLFGVSSPFGIVVDSFAGVFLLGYYLSGKCSRKTESFLIACGIGSMLLTGVLIVTFDDYKNFIFLNAPTMIFFTASIFLRIKRLFARTAVEPALIRIIGKYSYSILLIHWGVLHFVVKQKLHVDVLSGGIWGGCILMMVLTLLISMVGAMVLDHTILKWLEAPFVRKKSL